MIIGLNYSESLDKVFPKVHKLHTYLCVFLRKIDGLFFHFQQDFRSNNFPMYHYQYRIILIGDSTVGKSSLLRYFTEGKNAEISDPTVKKFIKNVKVKKNFFLRLALIFMPEWWRLNQIIASNCNFGKNIIMYYIYFF